MVSASKEVGAAASALGTYLTTVLPRVRRELRTLQPLPPEKEANSEAVAVFATLSPRARRPTVVRAIVALQVAIDLSDLAEEGDSDVGRAVPHRLEASWREEAATLPAYPAVAPHLDRAVTRCEEGQQATHAAAAGDAEPLRRWAEALEAPPGYRWWEVAAGASSSVAAHALIAAAADPRTSAETAALIDAAYHPPIGALSVLLDDLVDLDEDRAEGEHNYLTYYGSTDEAAARLGLIADRAGALVRDLPRAGRHRAILAGVAAFYLGKADTELGRAVRARLLKSVGAGARPLTAFTLFRRDRGRKRPG